MTATQEITIDGHVYAVTQLPGMPALKMLHRLGKTVGPALATAFEGGSSLASMELKNLGAAVQLLFANLSADELEDVVKQLLYASTVDNAPILPRFATQFQGQMGALVKLIKFALQVNYGNFFGDLAELGRAHLPPSSSAGSITSPKPGPVSG